MNSESVLQTIFGAKIIDMEFLKQMIRYNSSYLLSELETYSLLDEDNQTLASFENIYKSLSKIIIDALSNFVFQMPIEMAIATKPQ